MSWRARGRGALPCALAGFWLGALLAPEAWASRVVEIRVGEHSDYSRVVIELDRPSGYRIQGDAAQGLIAVSLDASARSEVLRPASGAIASIEVEPRPGGARASIRLRNTEVELRERLLANPPRIVLDFHREPPQEAIAPKPAPAPPVARAVPVPPAPPEPSTPPPPQAATPVEESPDEAEEPAGAAAQAAPEAAARPAREAELAVPAPLAEAEPPSPAEAAPTPAEPDERTGGGTALIPILGAGVAIVVLVLWLRQRRAQRGADELSVSAAASRAASEPAGESPAAHPAAAPKLGQPEPTGAERTRERIRRLAADEDKPPAEKPKAGTTMTSMTRQR